MHRIALVYANYKHLVLQGAKLKQSVADAPSNLCRLEQKSISFDEHSVFERKYGNYRNHLVIENLVRSTDTRC